MNKQKLIGAISVAFVMAASVVVTSATASVGPRMCLAFCQPVRSTGPALSQDLKLPARRDKVSVTLGTYPPKVATCVGAVCTVASGFDARYVVRVDQINVGQALVVLFRNSDDAQLWSETVPVTPYGTRPGGWLSVQTGILDCGGGANTAPNAYFRVKDEASGRWSIRQYVTTGCAGS